MYRTRESVIRTIRDIGFTSCTRTMSAPRTIPTEIAAAVPSSLSSTGKFRVYPINDFLEGPINIG